MGTSFSSSTESRRDIQNSKVDLAQRTGVLNLSDQRLRGSSSIWQQLPPNLKTLDISSNELKSLPSVVLSKTTLTTLNVSRCNLQRMESLTTLSRLKQLYLENNDLENAMLPVLPNSLVFLNLSFNHLDSFPVEIGVLTRLVELNLEGNRITTTVGVRVLSNLEILNLDDNLITEVSAEFGQLTHLTKLSIQRNKIGPKATTMEGQSISFEFFTGSSVISLNLAGNEGLTTAAVMRFEGFESFLQRRKKVKDKSFFGGALSDNALLGLP